MATEPRPRGISYGESIVVDNDNVFLLIGGNWYVYSKRRAHVGDGGMGSVLMGRRVGDGMPVAIKRIHAEFANRGNVRERVRLESQLTFAHPNLVEILGCCEGSGEKAPIFVASKFIHGQTIDVYVNASFPDKSTRARHLIPIIKQLTSAIDFIHSEGIIHLDIKPSNVMIERGSTVKLLDLGIADVATHSVKTHGYGLHGTPGFAAPEQYIDESNPELIIDKRTDVYGLAATTYTLITGNTPKQRELPENDEGIGSNLRNVMLKALAKEKEQRYASASEFAEAFETAAIKDSTPKKSDKWVIICILGAILTVTLLISIFILTT